MSAKSGAAVGKEAGRGGLADARRRDGAQAADGLGDQAVELLRELIRIDTTNPPGNERPAQELLAARLADAGFECELLGVVDERPNLIARLRGDRAGPALCLLGHVDTVPADPSEWSRDPWGGELAANQVWGRGAQDMKDQVAAEVAAAAELGRSGWRPESGELLVVMTADEETGATLGAKWLCEEHPEKVRSDLVINEGGGASFTLDGRRLYTLSVGEKGVFRFKLRARGRAGHGSVPALGDNALIKLAPAIERLRRQPPPEPTPEGLEFLERILGDPYGADDLEGALARLHEIDPVLAAYRAEPMVRVTLTPTRAEASKRDNVIPSKAEVLVDCRVPPGMSEPDVRARIEAVLDEDGDRRLDASQLEIEFTEQVVGNRSAIETPLWQEIERWIADEDPGAGIVPIVMPGFSDSHWFRKAFDSAIVYGFCPQRDMPLAESEPLVHGADERINVSDMHLAARFFCDMPRRLLS